MAEAKSPTKLYWERVIDAFGTISTEIEEEMGRIDESDRPYVEKRIDALIEDRTPDYGSELTPTDVLHASDRALNTEYLAQFSEHPPEPENLPDGQTVRDEIFTDLAIETFRRDVKDQVLDDVL